MPAVTTRRGPAEPAPEPGAEPGSEPAPASARGEPTPAPGLTPEQARDVMGQALARLQESQPAWRKADLVRHLGELLPDDVACPDDRAAATLLTGLADQVLAGAAGEQVLMLEAPEWPRVPDSLRRADGRSIYRPHSGTRYATLAQLTMEERLVAQAQQPGAPRLEPALAARLLGADLAQLEAQLQAPTQSHGSGAARHRLRTAAGPGRRRVPRGDQRPARGGPGRPGRIRQDPHRRRRGRAVAAGEARRGVRADHLPGRPRRPARGRGGPGRQHRRLPRPPHRRPRSPRPQARAPRHPATPGRGVDDVDGRPRRHHAPGRRTATAGC